MKWYGNAGHFCAAINCAFHLCTEVGEYLISTVGEYRQPEDKEISIIGVGTKGFYETFVFKTDGARCKCGCGLPEINLLSVEEIIYATPKEANEGHMDLCRKYVQLLGDQEEDGK